MDANARTDVEGFFQRLKSLRIEDNWKIDSQYIRDEEGGLLRTPWATNLRSKKSQRR